MDPLRVTFLLPFAGIAGGIRAVVQIADHLHAAGHDVQILWPETSICSRRNRVLRRLPGTGRFLRRNQGDLSWAAPASPRRPVPDLDARHVRDGDALVATAWQTAEAAMSYPPSKGARIYFVQHYETWSGPRRAVDRTWRAGFRMAVTAPWLADLARERFGIREPDLVPYGVDPDLFHPDPAGDRLRGGGFRVGLLAHPEAWKGTAEGLEAVRQLRDRCIDARPVLFGTTPPSPGWPETGTAVEFHLDPPQARLRAIYSSLDAYLCPSHAETGPLTVLEAMACGVCVVSTPVGSVPLWTRQGETGLLVPPASPSSAARALERLAREPGLRGVLADKGRERARTFTWAETGRVFEAVLRKAVSGSRGEAA